MKRWNLLPVLLSLCLLLGGCELRNRQSSDYYAPAGGANLPNGAGQGKDAPVIPTEKLPQEESLNPDPAPGKGPIKTVLSYQGKIPLAEPARYYSYELPMIDLPGAYAAGCNQELERVFGDLIRQCLQSMERYEAPVLERLSYTSYSQSGILTLRVDRRDWDGSTGSAYFSVLEDSGEQVSAEAFLAAAGLSDELEPLLTQAVTSRFEQRYGAVTASDTAATTALTRTLAELPEIGPQRMHLTEDGKLTVAVNLYSPSGDPATEELILP